MTDFKNLKMLIADKIDAECMKVKPDNKNNEILLQKQSTCRIRKPSPTNEINNIKLKFKDFIDTFLSNTGERLIWKDILCMNSKCKDKRIYDLHGGSGKVVPFAIERIDNHPSLSIPFEKAHPVIEAITRTEI